jgi:pteridine reductase
MLTQSLAKELAPGIRVNAISPGVIMWPEGLEEEKKSAILNETMMKRMGNVEDITKAVLFLINDADYITGQIINIDGGRTLYS